MPRKGESRAERGTALAQQLDGEDAQQMIADPAQARVSKSSRRVYDDSNARLAAYLARQHPHLVVDGKIDAQALVDDISIFKGFIMKLFRRKDGDGNDNGLRASSLSVYRSSLSHLLAEAGVEPPLIYKKQLRDFFGDLKRLDAEKRRENGEALTEGKDALKFALYRQLALAMLTDGRPQMLFAHCYLVLSWNLMCRNGESLAVSRIHWSDDCLAIYHAVSKSDQASDRVKDPIHVYANPSMPEICPVLALAMYLTVYGQGSSVLLFPGKQQGHRFSTIFGSLLKKQASLLLDYGLLPTDLGTHSMRKGAVTYTLGGSTAGPGILSVTLRAQWKQGIVQEKYMKYEAAADHYCGRTVAGLDLCSEAFAVLPPHLRRGTDEEKERVAQGVRAIFSTNLIEDAPATFQPVLRMCLASLVYHRQWLKANVNADCSLLRTTLFTSDDVYTALVSLTVSGNTSPYLRATGIPPHVAQIMAMNKLGVGLAAVTGEMRNLPRAVSGNVESLLREPAVTNGNMTPAAVRSQVDMATANVLARMTALVDRAAETVAQASARDVTAPTEPCQTSQTGPSDAHCWGGGLRRVPEGWVLPNAPLSTAWQLWMRGEPARNIRPLRRLKPVDLAPGRAIHKRFGEWRSLFNRTEGYLRAKGCLEVPAPSDAAANDMFHAAQPFFESRRKGTRPASVLAVSTVGRYFRGMDDSAFEALYNELLEA